MKRKKIILIGILFCFSINVQAGQNLREYYKQIAMAENYILAENYDKAAIHYREAFKNKDFAFQYDLINASICEAKSSNPSREACLSYALQIAKLRGKTTFHEALEEIGKSQLFKLDDSIVVQSYVDKELAQIISDMFDKDQGIRQEKVSGHIAIHKVDSLNMIQFRELIKSKKVLDERICPATNELKTLFIHWFRYHDFFDFYNPVLLQAVHEGTFDARIYARLIDFKYMWLKNSPYSTHGVYGSHFFTINKENCTNGYLNCKYYVFSTFNRNNPEEVKLLNDIDASRAEIYLGKTITDKVRDFKMHEQRLKKIGLNFISSSIDITIRDVNTFKEKMQEIQKQNSDCIYYITGEHDFNVK